MSAVEILASTDLNALAETFREGYEDWRFGKPDSRDLVTMVLDATGLSLPAHHVERLAETLYESASLNTLTDREYVVAVLAYAAARS